MLEAKLIFIHKVLVVGISKTCLQSEISPTKLISLSSKACSNLALMIHPLCCILSLNGIVDPLIGSGINFAPHAVG